MTAGGCKPGGVASKKKAPSATGVTQGSVGGGSMHYHKEEIEALMDIMEEIHPIGKFEKDLEEQVAERYNAMHHPTTARPREYVNLMAQFNKFASKKLPTGDPDCPLH
jgi:hypothetical protein